MSTIYILLSKIHLTDNYMKENSNKYCVVVNVKYVEISGELDQNLSGWQIYPSMESLGESSKRNSGKIDFSVLRGPNNLLGLTNYGFLQTMSFFKSVLYYLLLF